MNDLVRLGATLPVLERSDRALVAAAEQVYGAILGELARAQGVEHLVDVHHRAQALELYLVRCLRSREAKLRAQNLLAEARLRLEREIGKWLSENVRHEGGGDPRARSHRATVAGRLPEGVSKHDSSRWQRLASVPGVAFEEYVSRARDTRREITTKGVLGLSRVVRQRSHPAVAHPGSAVQDLRDLLGRGAAFGTIYADPPWRYRNTTSHGAAADHYETLPVEEIAALPVRQLAAANAHLHLWTTAPFLFEARAVVEAWGFTFKGVFVWCKEQMATGNYWRSAAEFLLLGVRGACPFLDHSVKNWMLAPRGEHSAKPAEVRALVERVSPPPRLELFARGRPAAGWSAWGNEVCHEPTPDELHGSTALALSPST